MARTKGKDGVLLAATNPVAQLRSWTVDATSDTAEGTAMGQDYKEFEATQQAWTGSAEAYYDATDTTGQGALVEGAELSVEFHPGGTGAGLPLRSGAIVVTGVTENASHDGFVEVSLTFQGTGALTRGVQA